MNVAMGMSVIYAQDAKRECAKERAEHAIAYTFEKPARMNFFRMLVQWFA